MPKLAGICAILAAALMCCTASFAAGGEVRDGFTAARSVKSDYFDVYLENGVNITNLTVRIAVPPSIKAVVRGASSDYSDLTLGNQLDLLYLAVSEIMDMRSNRFRCTVKICKDAASLSAIATKLFGSPVQPGGFYVVALNALYVDADNVDLNILGHELGHAVQTYYFVVPPPVKIQEVLAGYVEFQLRKYSRTLPE